MILETQFQQWEWQTDRQRDRQTDRGTDRAESWDPPDLKMDWSWDVDGRVFLPWRILIRSMPKVPSYIAKYNCGHGLMVSTRMKVDDEEAIRFWLHDLLLHHKIKCFSPKSEEFMNKMIVVIDGVHVCW